MLNLISGISSILSISILTPVQSILCLIILFISTSISLYINGYELMGILYVLIYVGAIAILFLFILSLLKIEYKPEGDIKPLSIIIIIILLIPIDISYDSINIIENINYINNELIIIGGLLYTDYSLLILITGIILILSVIGAISIVK